MADLQTEGKLDQLKGKVRSMWGTLTDDDLEKGMGDMQQMVGKIKERTGEKEEDIRQKLERLWNDKADSMDKKYK